MKYDQQWKFGKEKDQSVPTITETKETNRIEQQQQKKKTKID